MKKPVKILLLVLLFLFAIGATFFITYREAGALYRLEMSSGSSASLKTAEISSYLERYFIDDYDEKELADAAAEAMVEATDGKMVMLPAMGLFYVSDLMGGAKNLLIGNVIKSQFLNIRDWPFGAATSITLTLVMGLMLLIYWRAARLLNKKVELE